MPEPAGEPLPVARARALIAAALPQPGSEDVPVTEATGRIVAGPVLADAEMPAGNQAARNGYAVRAAATVGAGTYTPVSLRVVECSAGVELPAGAAVAVTSGDSLPAGADAVLPLESAAVDAGGLDVLMAVSPWSGVAMRGSELPWSGLAAAPGRRLRAQDAALMAALGMVRVPVLRRLRVGVITIGAKSGAADALTPLLAALLARDGGSVAFCRAAGRKPAVLRDAVARGAGAADLLIVAGGSGDGPDDNATPALADAGAVAVFQGVALRPGCTTGLWRLGEVPVLVLPGAPLGCMVAFDVLVSPGVRGVDQAYATTEALLERKVVSVIGSVDVVRVNLNAGRAAPLGDAEVGGLASLARADGFVLVPEASEGFAPESRVRVHLYGARREAE